jgi:SAM-dependent methyltransferase
VAIDDLALLGVEYKNGWRQAYARTTEALWQEEPIPFISDVVDRLRAESKARVLEPGCGDGRNTRRLVSEGFSVVGLDLSLVALQRLADEAANGPSTPVLVEGDIEQLPRPFPDRSFDAVVCFDVFGQLARPRQAVEAFTRLLDVGGVFVANLYTPRDVAFGEGEKVAERAYLYDDTLFRFYEQEDLPSIFAGLEIEHAEEVTWIDPPHPGYRETVHTHSNLVLWARRTAQTVDVSDAPRS